MRPVPALVPFPVDPMWPLLSLPCAVLRRLGPGRALVAQGGAPSHLFVVRSGAVRLAKLRDDGEEAVLDVLGPGDAVGHLTLLEGCDAEPLEARSITPVEVLAVAHDELRPLLRRRPDLAAWAFRLALDELARRHAVLADTLLGDVRGRVLSLLERLAGRHGRRVVGGVLVDLPLTQEELGRMVGATRESANRALARLAREGRLRRIGRHVVLADGWGAAPAPSADGRADPSTGVAPRSLSPRAPGSPGAGRGDTGRRAAPGP